MKILTHFHHVQVSSEFDQRLKGWISDKLSRWSKMDNLVVEAYVMAAVPRRDVHGATYECHLTATAPWLNKKIVVKESHVDFWTLLYDCVHTTKEQIQKLTSARRSRRRRWKQDMRIAI